MGCHEEYMERLEFYFSLFLIYLEDVEKRMDPCDLLL